MILRCHHYLCHQYGIDGGMHWYIDKHLSLYLNLLKSERYLVINCQMFCLRPTRAAILLICHRDHISLSTYDQSKINNDVCILYIHSCMYVCLIDLFLMMSKVTIDDWLIDDETSDIHHKIRYKNVWEHSSTDISFPI